MALPAQRTNLATNPSFETASGTVNVRTNLLLNPRGRIAGNVDFGPNVAVSYEAGGAVVTHNNGAAAGNAFFGVQFAATNGTVYYARAVLQDVTGTPSVQAAAHSSIGSQMGLAGVMTRSGTTLTREWSFTSTITGTARLLLDYLNAGTGESYRVTEMTVSTTPTAGVTYFDGATAAAGDFTYAWSGTANASTSHQQAPGIAGWTPENGAILHRTGTANMGSPYAARMTNGGDFYKIAGGAAPGQTWTFSVDYKTEGTVTGNPRLYISDMVTNTVYSPTLPLTQSATGRFSVTLPATATGTTQINCAVFGPTTGAILLDNALFEKAGTAGTYFDGSTVEAGWTHAWTGTANASTSTRDVYGIWPEQSTDAGAPKVQLTAIGLGGTSVTTKVVRESDGETWTVPGWKRRNTIGGHTMPDHSAPLGRPVTYTLYVNNSAVSSRTITVTSTQGWVQSPVQPELAMPIALDASDPNQLSLAKPSLKEVTYESRGDEEYPMGGSYPIARAATRGAAGGLTLVLNARTDAVSDSFLDIMKASPILLFRPLPTWGSTPALSYLRGNVVETPLTRDVGQGFTRWTAEGRLVAPVATAPLTGSVTNQMVANNLVGRTNSSVAAASANKRNIDIAANPLGLGV